MRMDLKEEEFNADVTVVVLSSVKTLTVQTSLI